MKQTRIVFCSDVHLCHHKHGASSPEEKLENLVQKLNEFHKVKPYEKIVFLGDYSLDHWAWNEKGSWLENGISNTERFVKEYASRLNAPYHMVPGNHEQYGQEKWKEIVGTPRECAFPVGGYLIVCCDNFSDNLDPDYHSDGTYTPTNLNFVKESMEQYPQLPVILCGHFFDLTKEPAEFYEFIKEEKRITVLICGHDHVVTVTDLEDRADRVCLYHDGHYSYAGAKKSLREIMWGFCEAVLSEDGVEMRYVEPDNKVMLKDGEYDHQYRERYHRFFKRRDL